MDSPGTESSTRRSAHQVAEEALRTRRSITPKYLEEGSDDLEEEVGHGSKNNVASPASCSRATTTTTITHPVLQVVGGQAHVASNSGVQFAMDEISYPYSKYSNHPDARSHVKKFQSIWAVNHGIQGLSATNAE